MTPHGPDLKGFEKGSSEPMVPQRIAEGTMVEHIDYYRLYTVFFAVFHVRVFVQYGNRSLGCERECRY